MSKIEKVKFWLGIVLILLAIFGGLMLFIESFGDAKNSRLGFRYIPRSRMHGDEGSLVASNSPFFFGFCTIAGAWLLNSVKTKS